MKQLKMAGDTEHQFCARQLSLGNASDSDAASERATASADSGQPVRLLPAQQTALQLGVYGKVTSLHAAQDWKGLQAIEPEACAAAVNLHPVLPTYAMEIYGDLGDCYELQGQYEKAVVLHEKSKAICAEMGDKAGLGVACSNLGNCYERLGQYEKAIASHEQDLALAEELGDRVGIGAASGCLGFCYMKLVLPEKSQEPQYEKAIAFHDKDLEIAKEIDDKVGMARAGCNLGVCYFSLGLHERAIDFHQESRAMYEEVKDPAGVVRACVNLGDCYQALGNDEKAAHWRACSTNEQAGDGKQK